MSYGAQIYNATESIIISEAFRNYLLVSVTTQASGVSPPSVAADEMLFVRPTVMGATVYVSAQDVAIPYPTVYVTSGAIQYARVKIGATSNPISGFGMVVYGSAGSVAYSSEQRALCPVASYTVYSNGYPYSTPRNLPFPVPLGKQRYVSLDTLTDTGFINTQPGEIPADLVGIMITWTSDVLVYLREDVTLQYGGPIIDYDIVYPGNRTFLFADI